MTEKFQHSTTCFVHDDKGKAFGEIDIIINYSVSSFGRPAYISGPPEDCYPAEGPEVEFEGLSILAGQPYRASQNAAWGWLEDWASDYCHNHADELAGEAGEQLHDDRADDYDRADQEMRDEQ